MDGDGLISNALRERYIGFLQNKASETNADKESCIRIDSLKLNAISSVSTVP